MTRGGLMVAAMVASSLIVWAQGAPGPTAPPQAKPAPPAPGSSAQPGAAPGAGVAQPAAEPYTYNSEGRRDPFVSLVLRGGDTGSGKRAEGIAGLTTAEIVVRGVLLSRGTYLALVSGPDGKTYTAHANDRLADGMIRSITPQGLVIMQAVNDPLSLIKQREVRKGLRSSEDGKQQ